MDVKQVTTMMQANAHRIEVLVTGVSEVQARWKPDPATWSILEVVNHLLDEEREDFRVRIDFTLHRPGAKWPPIDPAAWVTQRRYNARDLQQSLASFLEERQASVNWLLHLPSPDWNQAEIAPWGDPFPAGNLLAAWVAHDLLHLRQLVELHWAWTTTRLAPWNVQYAGDW